MRVLYLTQNPYRVGSIVPLEGWLASLPDRGLQPVLVSNQLGPFHEWAVSRGVPSYQVALPMPNKLWPWKFFASLARLRRIVKRHRIELIHCNEQDIYPIGQYLGKWCGVPVVVSIHFTMNRDYCTWAFGQARSPRRMFFISKGNRDAC